MTNIIYKNFRVLFMIVFTSIYLVSCAQLSKQSKEEQDTKKHNLSSEFFLNQTFDLIKNMKTGEISEFSPDKLKKVFGLPIRDLADEDDRKNPKFVANYGSYVVTSDDWEFSYEVYNKGKIKYFEIYLEPVNKEKEQVSTCKTSYWDFSKKLLSLGLEERRSYGSVLVTPLMTRDTDRIGELVSTFFLDKYKSRTIETAPLKYRILDISCTHSVMVRVS